MTMKTHATNDGTRVTIPEDDSAVQDVLYAAQEYYRLLDDGHTPDAAFLLSGLRKQLDNHREELAS